MTTSPSGREVRRSSSAYASLPRTDLAKLLPELLLAGQVVDRSGMPWCTFRWGQEEMSQIAVEEWMGASPIYTRRMQETLDFVGDDVPTIFKGLQLDCGAPPQYMDFRYTVHDTRRGFFELAHCGALMDVEPLGEELVTLMCHDMEDPTFDATAVATNPRARMRPVHRPPRMPVGRSPHCKWEVFIDETLDPLPIPDVTIDMQSTMAACVELDPIDLADEGASDYSGPLVTDIDFEAFSASTLSRMADEVVLQLQLLTISFARAVLRRSDDQESQDILANQALGFSAIVAERLMRALDIERTKAGALRLLSLHPVFNPTAYVLSDVDENRMLVHRSPAHHDESWLRQCGPSDTRVLQGIVRAVDPSYDVEVFGTSTDWELRIIDGEAWDREPAPVSLTRLSGATTFEFGQRTSLPISPI